MNYTEKCFNWWVERQRYSIHQQFGIHDTSIKPKRLKLHTDRQRNRHNSSVAFVNGRTLKKKLAFSKFYFLVSSNYTFPLLDNYGLVSDFWSSSVWWKFQITFFKIWRIPLLCSTNWYVRYAKTRNNYLKFLQ